MSYEGFKTTQKGRDLLAKMLAGETLELTKVMAGTGTISGEEVMDGLTDLLVPVMEGTSSVPEYLKDVMTMTLQFRSDMAPSTDFSLQEYGIFANDPEEGEILLYYANLGDNPQKLPGNTGKYFGVLDFNIAITVGEDLEGVNLGYPANAFLSKEELESHDKDPNAHADLMHPRIQLWVREDVPTEDGTYLWISPPVDDNGNILFEFPEKIEEESEG